MGMTIEEALDVLKNGTTKEHGADAVKEFLEAKDIAIDTMRKYQKIKDIVKNNNGFTDSTLEHSKAFTKIAEVVEDGKVR